MSDGSVHYSANAGRDWDQAGFKNQPGPIAPLNGIALDPKNPDRVTVVLGGASGIHSKYRTARVFLTSDSGQNWTDISGTDGNGPAGNLPDLPMHSVVFDTSVVPSALIVASDAGVMRSTDFAVNGTVGTATWKAYGVGLPTVSCSALAIDNSVNPPVLRVGTYGRSCFELTRSAGPQLYSGPNLAVGSVGVGRTGSLALDLYNCGSAPLNVNRITVTESVLPSTASYLSPSDRPWGQRVCQVTFSPAAVGDAEATRCHLEQRSFFAGHAPVRGKRRAAWPSPLGYQSFSGLKSGHGHANKPTLDSDSTLQCRNRRPSNC